MLFRSDRHAVRPGPLLKSLQRAHLRFAYLQIQSHVCPFAFQYSPYFLTIGSLHSFTTHFPHNSNPKSPRKLHYHHFSQNSQLPAARHTARQPRRLARPSCITGQFLVHNTIRLSIGKRCGTGPADCRRHKQLGKSSIRASWERPSLIKFLADLTITQILLM